MWISMILKRMSLQKRKHNKSLPAEKIAVMDEKGRGTISY